VREYKNYINGKFVDGKGAFAAIDPATGRPVAWVHEADAMVVDLAVDSARKSLNASWHTMPIDDRCAVMRSVADEIECRSDDLVDAEVADTGQPETRIRDFDIVTAANHFRTARMHFYPSVLHRRSLAAWIELMLRTILSADRSA
jgi:aminomuconate-semialdehyde/2-hydroxymuconate-6-semialdehyde dehydrogenase